MVALLPLQADDEPAFTWTTKLVANEAAGPNARLRTRPRLTMSNWCGNIDAAARVADKLVDNAARHGKPLEGGYVKLRLTVLRRTDELLIEVDDGYPDFPNFDQAVASGSEPGQGAHGLWWVLHYRGRLAWDVKRNDDGETVGKTVQAVLPPTWEGAS
jgi:hypothetical protein